MVLPSVLVKVSADKKFIQNDAKKGISACSKSSPIGSTSDVICDGVVSKSAKMAEYSIESLLSFVESCKEEFFLGGEHQNSALNLIKIVFGVMEDKKPRMTKHASPLIKLVLKYTGEKTLKEMAVKATT